MNRAHRVLVFPIALIIATAPAHLAAQKQSEAGVRAAALKQADAWNRHDAPGYAALFTEDCDVVNVVGWWWRGRAEVERKLAVAFATVFRESTLSFTDVQVRFLQPGVALAHARWTMVGARTPAGIPEPREGIQTLVFTRSRDRWLIAAFQNTHSIPERPFPTEPDTTPVSRP
jgi:uncharacterized protein (TIGR02246 family)